MLDLIKIAAVVGTRPELIRLSCLTAHLDSCTHHTLIHTCLNYEYEVKQVFFDELEIRKPDYAPDADKETGVVLQYCEIKAGSCLQTLISG